MPQVCTAFLSLVPTARAISSTRKRKPRSSVWRLRPSTAACRFTQVQAASAPVIRFVCPEKPRNWGRMCSPSLRRALLQPPKKNSSSIMRRLQTQWICRSCCTTSPPARAMRWPLPQCKSCLRWQTLWAQRIPAVTLTISCSISRKHAGAINRSPCCPATIP